MTDVYSLGVVLYEVLAGTKPYRLRRQTDAEWEQAILAVEPLKPSVSSQRTTGGTRDGSPEARRNARRLSGDLDNIVLKALSKQPEQRYASVEALSLDLQRHLHGRPVQARAPSWGYQLHKYVLRHRWALASTLAATSLLGVALAISVSQGRQAMRETQRAQAMQDFVIGLFDNAGVAQQGNIFDARKLLVAGERRGERELASQPLALAELLGVITRLRIGLGDYQDALGLLERQQKLLAQLDDPPAALQLEAVTQHGRILRLLDRAGECLRVMAPAEAMVSRLPSQHHALEADFLSQYGRCRRVAGERLGTQQLFERSLSLRRSIADEAGVAENLYDLALDEAELGRTDAALAGYDKALAHLRKHVGNGNPLTVEIQVSRARLFRSRGDIDAAKSTLLTALAIASEVHGDQHPTTLGVRRLLVAVLTDQEHYADAARQIEPLYELTVESLGREHRETGLALNTRGIIALEQGRMASAMADLAEAVRIWRGASGSQNLHNGLFNYGMVLHHAGRQEAAMKALLESRLMRANRYGASDASVGEVDRMIGEVLDSQGKLDAAGIRFDRAVKLTRIGLGAEHPRTLEAELSMARHQARIGKSTAAIRTLERLSTHPAGGDEAPKLHWRARAYAAEARCALGQRNRARRELEALAAELRQQRPDGGLVTREVLAIGKACAG